MMKEQQPHLKFVFHDAFHYDPNVWNDLFDDNDKENVIMDSHQQLAWEKAQPNIESQCTAYEKSLTIADSIKYPVWIGEWSLATDVCAMWLGGFNDNNTPYQYECEWVDCPKTQMPEGTGTDFDRTAEILGPFGQNKLSTVQSGKCPRDSLHFGDADIKKLGSCMMNSLNSHVEAQFFWTVRTELEDRWNQIKS